jgi:Lrp/AsnC family transcriptional regulator, leucine-responsive regulatory protein
MDLDATDLRLLDLLQPTPRCPTRRCAALPTPRRHLPAPRRRLVETGVIERQVALLSPLALGAG